MQMPVAPPHCLIAPESHQAHAANKPIRRRVILPPMNLLTNSFWRAAAYCLHPQVIALSVLPLALMVAFGLGAWYLLWDPAVLWVSGALQAYTWLTGLWNWLQGLGMGGVKTVLAPIVIVVAIMPLVVMLSLLAVALLMTPALVRLVAQRRFDTLERKKGAGLATSVAWSLGSTLLALVAVVISIPLWFVPPLVLILPPLIWGWLTYRVMTFDALAEHASTAERREVFRRHRGPLLTIGVITGYLGAAPSLVWASGVVFVAAFVVLIPLAIWIYTLVFAFSSLWFSHYCLSALDTLRREQALDEAVKNANLRATDASGAVPAEPALPAVPFGLPKPPDNPSDNASGQAKPTN